MMVQITGLVKPGQTGVALVYVVVPDFLTHTVGPIALIASFFTILIVIPRKLRNRIYFRTCPCCYLIFEFQDIPLRSAVSISFYIANCVLHLNGMSKRRSMNKSDLVGSFAYGLLRKVVEQRKKTEYDVTGKLS